ncbi:MAG: AAA family ATPase [Clostridia bacterium]|nr:AAA family ATPase [Clostridia bacterium]
MDEEKILVIANGEDKTKEIEFLTEKDDKTVDVKFYKSEKIYNYCLSNIIIIKEAEKIDLQEKDVYYKNQILFNISKIIKFKNYVKVIFTSGDTQIFKNNDLSFKSNSIENINKNVIEYFREISNFVKNGKEEENETEQNTNESFLNIEYGKLNYINEESILNYYINKIELANIIEENNNIIYPFRFNLSQKRAMENVFKSNISIIQGPPGTGKTQTILNIIANLAIMQNKTVAVVSNNNEAVKNVKDKLQKDGYDFIVADLGRKSKREKFFENLPQPNVKKFNSKEEEGQVLNRIRELNNELDSLLEKNNKKAKLEKEIDDLKLEQTYFEEYYKKQDVGEIGNLSFYNKTDDKILEFMLDSQMLYENKVKLKWFYKIKILFKYGITNLKLLDEKLIEIILSLQKDYYKLKIEKLEEDYTNIKNDLKKHNFDNLQKEHQKLSEKVFKKEYMKSIMERITNLVFKVINKI